MPITRLGQSGVLHAGVDATEEAQAKIIGDVSGMEVQIFGIRKDSDTRKALRFFSERRIRTHFVDLMERAASLGELRRFAQKFGVDQLVDRDSRRYRELGLHHAILSADRWLEKLADEPLLLRMPLVRNGNQLTIGVDESAWRSWTSPPVVS